MKKTLIAFAALSAIAGVAQAQSTVTLYGVADAHFGQKTQTVGGVKTKQTVVDSAGMNTSRFGLRGTEDLGGGLKAVFTMEAGVAIDTGAGNLNGGGLFSRQAFVGLSGNFGTATLGRQYTAYDALRGATNNSYDATYFGGITGDVWNNGVVDYSNRVSNSFAYASPVFSGFSGGFVLSGGEDKNVGGSSLKASYNNSLHIKYANGPLLVGYAYQAEKYNPGTTIQGPTAVVAAGTGKRQYNLFAASYDFGVAKITGGYNTAKQENSTPATNNNKDKEFQFGVSVPFGAASVAAGYSRSKTDSTPTFSGKAVGYSLLGTYDLSKRTRLYAGLLNEKFTNTPTAALTRKTGAIAGIRHSF